MKGVFMRKKRDLTGKRFGRLSVVMEDGRSNYGERRWKCSCDCGNVVSVTGKNLVRGASRSCGCLRNERVSEATTTHGMSKTKLYRTWERMRSRCGYQDNPAYNNYGKRGIRVCEEWDNDFLVFYNWAMDNGYSEGLSIDRIDNNGDYEPDNCRWATRKQQMNNTRTNHMITYNGETKTISQWADFFDIDYKLFYNRLSNNNWEIDGELLDARDMWTKLQGGCIDVSTFRYDDYFD
jgi:hypothetical protein